ncbi:thiolase family protein [Paracoccus sp. S-4012]|uniref:thiolase family protein n=1 Tax=Paracoccus sp. S-4012 TaxID=2665648 RepID=UPI0018A22C7A|nr:thiolase family protein [Paracoccus sp. S-4012]
MTTTSELTFENVAVVDFAESGVTKTEVRTSELMLSDVVSAVLRRTGVEKSKIDGFALSSYTALPDRAGDTAVSLGLTPKWIDSPDLGGVSGLSAVLRAARAIESGESEYVLCCGVDALSTENLQTLLAENNKSLRDFLAPVGAASSTTLLALLQDAYSREFNLDAEILFKIASEQRRYGSRNPLAMFRSELTRAEYDASRQIAGGLKLFDCLHSGFGAAAVLLTNASNARATSERVAYIRGGGEQHGHDFSCIDHPREIFRSDWPARVARLLRECGIDHSDIDMFQCYDDTPFLTLMQYEAAGFCETGQGSVFLRELDISRDGDLPVNTGGGMLACGQAGVVGGFVPVIEAVRQVSGRAGENQVEDANNALVMTVGLASQFGPRSSGVLLVGGH